MLGFGRAASTEWWLRGGGQSTHLAGLVVFDSQSLLCRWAHVPSEPDAQGSADAPTLNEARLTGAFTNSNPLLPSTAPGAGMSPRESRTKVDLIERSCSNYRWPCKPRVWEAGTKSPGRKRRKRSDPS